jgi:hypothetical protein
MRQNLKSPTFLAAGLLFAASAAQALPVAPLASGSSPALELTQVRGGHGGGHGGGGFHGGGHGGYHGGGYHGGVRHGGAYHGGAYRGGRHYGGGAAWVRPGYRWPPGGAIAAGAAIGVISAAAAAAWASAPPQPGLCWYYTDASRRTGFWDTCP